MGCGSSAAGRLAAIALADHFGELGWDDRPHSRRGLGARRTSGQRRGLLAGRVCCGCLRRHDGVHVARVIPPAEWRAIVVLPTEPLATSKARAVLPRLLRPRRCGGQPASGCDAGTGLCAGTRRSAARRHARPDPPALPRRHLPAASAAAALGRAVTDHRRCPERCRPGGARGSRRRAGTQLCHDSDSRRAHRNVCSGTTRLPIRTRGCESTRFAITDVTPCRSTSALPAGGIQSANSCILSSIQLRTATLVTSPGIT